MRNWRDFKKIYFQSIFNSYKQPIFWIVISLCSFLAFFFIVLMPLILFWSMHDLNGGFGSSQTITMTSTILIPFFASFIAEINSSPNERIFILSRPINRDIYLISKFFASLTITICVLIISVVCIWMIWGIFRHQIITEYSRTIGIIIPGPFSLPFGNEWKGIIIIVPPKPYNFNFVDLAFQSASPIDLCLNLLMLTFFGTVVGQCYSVYFREAVPSILVMVLAMLYTMPFSVFTFTKTGTTLFTTPNDFLFQLQFKYLPIAVWGGGGILLLLLSFYFNRKIDDGR